ncbi:PBP1A family penicillin-binding protein, partial [Deltaproteobacteria bacterium OttesenSCG-928-K17]|nr:PBP1A family penicillin-binding protein [Deltaproteobacteria bacterium OttesenSCG-928-K17]
MEENKKKRRPPRPAPDVDIAGPAAWGEDRPSAPRRRVRRKPEAAGDAGPGIRRPKTDGPAKAAPKTKAAPKAKKASKPKKRSLKMRFLIWMIWSCLGLGVLGVAAGVVGYSYIDQDLPSTDGLKNYAPPIVTYIYSDDGRVIGEYSHERRFVVPVEKISPLLINAIIAVEDDKFYDHNGVNYKAILRAAIANYRSGETVQGGSTITQQVVKTFLLTPERTYTRKFKEMILAYRIENNLTKEEILYLYLNQIYLGRGAYGVEAAARTYFGKSALDLNLTEAAQIAGIIRNPSKNPVNDPAHGRDRMLTALQRMEETGFITAEERAAARDVKMNFMVEWPNPNTTVTPYFTEHVRRILEERFGADSLYNDGWKVYTTVNVDAQNAADAAVAKGLWEYARRRGYKGPVEELEGDAAIDAFLAKSAKELPDEGLELNHLYLAVVTSVDKKDNALTVQAGPYQGLIAKKNLDWALKKTDISKRFKKGDVVWVRLLSENELEKKQAPDNSGFIAGSLTAAPLDFSLEQRTDIQSALLSMDLENGDIKAMVGGRDFSESQFNRAVQSQRQPGSSFKPILYASAMDNGFTPGSIMNDAPFVIDDPGSGKRWKPVNSDLKFKGPMTLYTALVGSRNLISIKILDRIGYDALAATARDLGITEKLPEYLAVALGAHGVRIPELVTAYSAFANMGVRVEPRYITRIEDRNGNIVESFEPKRTEALDPGSACAVTWMLRGVVDHGTGTAVKALKRPVGGKTGTTNDYSDAWFIGFTPELVTAVWVGTDEQRPRAVGETGGRVAGPIFLYYMREALKDVPITDFTVPPEAEIAPGGSFGICYKAGTIGTGFSETINADTPEDEFLREDFEDMEGEILGGDEGPDGAWDQPEPERSSGGLFNRIFSR